MFVDGKGLASNGRLIDLEESIIGNNAAICGNDGTLHKFLLVLAHLHFFGPLSLLLQFGEYHQEQLQELRLQRVVRHGEQQPSAQGFSSTRPQWNQLGILG
jgi:hypothetical protein